MTAGYLFFQLHPSQSERIVAISLGPDSPCPSSARQNPTGLLSRTPIPDPVYAVIVCLTQWLRKNRPGAPLAKQQIPSSPKTRLPPEPTLFSPTPNLLFTWTRLRQASANLGRRRGRTGLGRKGAIAASPSQLLQRTPTLEEWHKRDQV